MKVKYTGALSVIEVAGHGVVERGGEIDLPEAVAKGIVRANPGEWQVVKASDGKPSSKKEE